MVGLVATGGLLATAGALAATGVLPTGTPFEPTHVNRDPARGVGVPVDASSRLLPIRVADRYGGPPWGLRLVKTSRGLLCLQVGRVVGDQLGVLGQDGLAGNDGRFHPLSLAAASTSLTPCWLPDGAGQFFAGIDDSTYASGESRERTCYAIGEDPAGREPCPAGDMRHLSYGLLGPQAAKITFSDGSTATPTGPDGAYLWVGDQALGAGGVGMGDAPMVAGLDAGVRRIDYRDGTSCPAPGAKRPFCEPKGYVPRPATKPSASLRRPVRVAFGHRRFGNTPFRTMHVSFRAPAAISDAQRMYVLEGRFPHNPRINCRRVIVFAPSTRNVKRGDRVRLDAVLASDCRGRLEASVLFADPSYSNGNQPAALVARIERQIR
jgi:hypothetical protein